MVWLLPSPSYYHRCRPHPSLLLHWTLILLFIAFIGLPTGCGARTICNFDGCNCTVKAASWQTVNCTFKSAQSLQLEFHNVPESVVEIFIAGGQSISFGKKSLDLLPGLTLVQIHNARNVFMDKQSFHNITSPSLLVQISNCDQFVIKTGAFENVQSSVELEVVQCDTVGIEKLSFNKFKSGQFKNIQHLNLVSGSFEFKDQGIIGRHGPVTVILIENVKIHKIPSHTFFSLLAEVTIRSSEIESVENEAFYAIEISSVSLIQTKIHRIQSGAFTQRTLILNMRISGCVIYKLESKAIMAAISNFTVEHSKITEVEEGAVNSTVARVEIVGNKIDNFHSQAFSFQNWDTINVEQNVVAFLHANFLAVPINYGHATSFRFAGNEIYNFERGALAFVSELQESVLHLKDNYFNQTCHCEIHEWVEELISANSSRKVRNIIETTFCWVNELLSQCFELPTGVINIQNFTELVCNINNTIICEPYRGETKTVNVTNKILPNNIQPTATSWLTLIISCTSLLLLAVIATFVTMLVRGSRWLKRKGYFRKMQYNSQNERSNDDENTIETVDENDRFDIIQEDLTMDLLQDLSKKLDDPATHQQASEMIEQLYQKYIRNEGNDNNNQQQEEEAHLYEELGNMQQNHESGANKVQTGPRGILRLMEERFNTRFEDIDAEDDNPTLVSDYSEPSDAAVHLYSELKQNKEAEQQSSSSKNGSLHSKSSMNMAFRPLPDKPGSSKSSF